MSPSLWDGGREPVAVVPTAEAVPVQERATEKQPMRFVDLVASVPVLYVLLVTFDLTRPLTALVLRGEKRSTTENLQSTSKPPQV